MLEGYATTTATLQQLQQAIAIVDSLLVPTGVGRRLAISYPGLLGAKLDRRTAGAVPVHRSCSRSRRATHLNGLHAILLARWRGCADARTSLTDPCISVRSNGWRTSSRP